MNGEYKPSQEIKVLGGFYKELGKSCPTFQVEKLPLADIVVGKRYRKEMGNLASLAESMHDLGLLQPIVVTKVGRKKPRLIAGARRLAAADILSWERIDCIIVNSLDNTLAALRAERDENTCHKDFTPSEAVAIGKALEELVRLEAKKRQATSTGGAEPKAACGNLPQAESRPGKTRDKVAEVVGMSGRTFEKAKAVVEAAEEDPEKFAPILKRMDETGKVDPAYKEVKRKKRPVDEVVKAWHQQEGEESQEWLDRLKQVSEEDQKGNERKFVELRWEAQSAVNKEEERRLREEKFHERFDVSVQAEKIYDWLVAQREKWPEQHRGEFTTTVRTIVERLETEDGARASKT
jgi:ParB-like chromosome segregation protein Spo0J